MREINPSEGYLIDNTIHKVGAGFQLYRPDGSLITQSFTYPTPTTIDTFYTNDEGYLVTPEKLEYGTGYSLVEVFAPYGYVLNTEHVYFDVVQDNSENENGITVIEVVKPNMAQKGVINISKSGEVFSTVTEAEGLYQPVYTVQGLPGAVYEITAAEDIITLDGTLRASKGEVVDTVTTDENGTATSKNLYLGKYEVKEITAPHGMVLNDEIHSVELVYAGQEIDITETSTSFYNERQKVEITLDKLMEQDEKFGIGQNGELTTDDHYILGDAKYPVVFEYAGQDTALVEIKANDGASIENDLIRGTINGLKTDEDGEALGGAVMGLFKLDEDEFTKENAILTATSKEDGSFSFADVAYGNYVVREIEAPTGYVLSEETFPTVIDKDGAVIEIALLNTLIRGNVQLTKVDKDYPDNHLTGAVFEVYKDSNGNEKLDKDDELLGTLNEVSTGNYEMTDLLYGGYFVKEKTAPEGFILDENAYYFEIMENGKTVTVENEVGKGFLNAAQTGNFKIVKTSSDGKLEGFSFKVTGADYDKTFITDKNGEIHIENLRIGEYTISEIKDSASSGYVLPANKQATVKTDSTTVVAMHNEAIDTPKTGDDSKPWLWLTLMGFSAVGAVTLGVSGFKKRKKEDDE